MLYAYTAVNSREREMEDSHFRRGNCWMLREQVRQPCTLVREPMLGRGEASSMFRALKMIIEHVKRGFESSNEPCRAQILDTEILPGDQVSRLVFASPLLSLLARNLIDTPLDIASSYIILLSIRLFTLFFSLLLRISLLLARIDVQCVRGYALIEDLDRRRE